MKLKNVYVDMVKQFGKLTFAGAGEEDRRRVNGRMAVQQRSFHLYSDVAKDEDVVVKIPGMAGVKNFEYEDVVELINPRIVAEGYQINNRGLTNYVLYADNIVKKAEV